MSASILTEIKALIKNLEDPRSKHGIRFPFEDFMAAIILGVMCGCGGYRQLARFMENHETFLKTHLNFKKDSQLLKVIDTIRYGAHTHSINALFWPPSGQLVSGSDDRSLMVWDLDFSNVL
jgi:hypothetical protein